MALISMHKTTYVSTLQNILFKSNLAEFLALYGGNLDFLDKFLTLAYARTKNLSKKSQFPP